MRGGIPNVGARSGNRATGLLGAALWILAGVSSLWSAPLTAISGTFKTPDGTAITGYVLISIKKPAVANLCSGSIVNVSIKKTKVSITSGTLGAVSLYPTTCLTPAQPYTVEVYDSNKVLLYRGTWTVPNTGTANVINL